MRDVGEGAKTILSVIAIVSALIGLGVWKASIDTRFEAMAADNARTYQTISQATADLQSLVDTINSRSDKTDVKLDNLSQRISTIEGYLKQR